MPPPSQEFTRHTTDTDPDSDASPPIPLSLDSATVPDEGIDYLAESLRTPPGPSPTDSSSSDDSDFRLVPTLNP